MKIRSFAIVALAVGLAAATGCVEDSGEEPNSEKGYLFVDLREPLAAGWEAGVTVRGPRVEGEHCDDTRGCYSEHQTIEMREVTSSDPDVVEVRDFEADSYGETDAVLLDLEAGETGEATLEFEFEFQGPAPDLGEESANSSETEDSNSGEGDNSSSDGEETGDPETYTDSFGVEVREVSSLQLTRLVDDVDPNGPYGNCPETGPGMYLMNTLEDYSVALQFLKLDNRGQLLRGSGKFPVEMDPEEAVDVEPVDGAPHQIAVSPNQFGPVEMTPEGAGTSLEARFVRWGDVTQMEVTLFRLTEEGGRGGESSGMAVDSLYEVEAGPALDGSEPLCGGRATHSVTSMTPAICEVYGEVEATGNPAVLANNGGQCRLEITLQDGDGNAHLVDDRTYSVEYNW